MAVAIVANSGNIKQLGLGPILSPQGNWYAFYNDDNGTTAIVRAYKSNGDPPTSFSLAQSLTVTEAGSFTIQALPGFVEGNIVHLMTATTPVSTTNYRYHQYDMSSDTFVVSNELITSVVSGINQGYLGGICKMSNGDILAYTYGPKVATKNRTYFQRRVSGTWGAQTLVDDLATNGGNPILLVKDPQSDRVHFLVEERTAVQWVNYNLLADGSTIVKGATIGIPAVSQAGRGIGYVNQQGKSRIVFGNYGQSNSARWYIMESSDSASMSLVIINAFQRSFMPVFYKPKGLLYGIGYGDPSSGGVQENWRSSPDDGNTFSANTVLNSTENGQYFANLNGVYRRGNAAGAVNIPYVDLGSSGNWNYNELQIDTVMPQSLTREVEIDLVLPA